MTVKYQTYKKCEFNIEIKQTLAMMLKKQGKVKGPFDEKASNCELICIAYLNDEPIAIGAIKKVSESVFNLGKSGLINRSNEFKFELGYLYTDPNCLGKGIASEIVDRLLNEIGFVNLIATTEVDANPAMVRILKNKGFKLAGNPWKSRIHREDLGLFLREPSQL